MQKAVLLFFCFLLFLSPVPAFAEDGDFLGDQVTYEEPNFMEKMLAKIFAGIAYVLIKVLGLKDINTLVFQSEHKSLFGQEYEMVYNTFTTNMWEAINRFYESFSDVSYYLLFIGIVVWALLMLFQSADPEGQATMRDFMAGIVIFVLGTYFAGNIVKLFFEINNFFVGWSVQVLRTYNFDPYTTDYVESLIKRITDSSPFGLEAPGAALVFLVVVCVVAVLNYQYTVRLLVLGFLVILLPVVLYASIFPSSRKAFDIWAREFAVQAWMPGAHAIAFTLFYALVSTLENSGLTFLALLTMLMGMLSVVTLLRIALGAPGGKFSGSLGFGSAAAISMILRSIRGRSVKATANVTPAAGAGMPNMSTNMAGGMSRGLTLGLLARGTPSLTGSGGSFVAKTISTAGGMLAGSALGLAATAVTGNIETGVLGAVKGYEVGKGATSAVANTVSSARKTKGNTTVPPTPSMGGTSVRPEGGNPAAQQIIRPIHPVEHGERTGMEDNTGFGISVPNLPSTVQFSLKDHAPDNPVPLTNRVPDYPVKNLVANISGDLNNRVTDNRMEGNRHLANIPVAGLPVDETGASAPSPAKMPMNSGNVHQQTPAPIHVQTEQETIQQKLDKAQINLSQPYVPMPKQEQPEKTPQQPTQPPVLPSIQKINTVPSNLQNMKKDE